MISIKKYIDIVLNAIYGCIIGVANIIPGVSGGTMAVMLNIYDKLIDSFTGLRRNFKKSIKFLLPVLIGAGLGIVIFSKLIKLLIEHCPLPTCFFFIGLIVGSMPLVFRKALEKKFRPLSLIPLAVFLAGMIILAFVRTEGQAAAEGSVQLDAAGWFFYFGASAVAAMCMIIPGVSGSMILMIFGIYASVIEAISGVTKHFGDSVMLLIPVGLGVIAGIVFGAKVIDICIKRFPQMTYFAIIGLMLGSPLTIFMKFMYQSEIQPVNNFVFTPVNIIVSSVVCIVGFAIALFFGSENLRKKLFRKNKQKNSSQQINEK